MALYSRIANVKCGCFREGGREISLYHIDSFIIHSIVSHVSYKEMICLLLEFQACHCAKCHVSVADSQPKKTKPTLCSNRPAAAHSEFLLFFIAVKKKVTDNIYNKAACQQDTWLITDILYTWNKY